jgi:hypothetical protein
MFAFGVGGIDVTLAGIDGEPGHLRMPEVWGIKLKGELPPWVSAKDRSRFPGLRCRSCDRESPRGARARKNAKGRPHRRS